MLIIEIKETIYNNLHVRTSCRLYEWEIKRYEIDVG